VRPPRRVSVFVLVAEFRQPCSHGDTFIYLQRRAGRGLTPRCPLLKVLFQGLRNQLVRNSEVVAPAYAGSAIQITRGIDY
jgi:hypothetical protein